jgi:Lipopolysaccharide-assembly
MMLKSRSLVLLLVPVFILLPVIFQSCKVSYSFTGANISADVKTFSVYYFPNRAKLINPTLSTDLTEKLKEKLLKQTSLREETENGDLVFEGQITEYDVRPMAIQKQDMAAQNRLTVGIRLKYTNNRDHEQDFDKSFSAFEDFSSSLSLNDVESSILPEIVDKLLEDIFNATIANW